MLTIPNSIPEDHDHCCYSVVFSSKADVLDSLYTLWVIVEFSQPPPPLLCTAKTVPQVRCKDKVLQCFLILTANYQHVHKLSSLTYQYLLLRYIFVLIHIHPVSTEIIKNIFIGLIYDNTIYKLAL